MGASLASYVQEGYAPEAVVNYLCLLGWSPKGTGEKMSLQEVVDVFDLPQILRHNARFDFTKLQWLNGEYLRVMNHDRYHELAVHALARAGIDTNKYPLSYVKAALDTCKEKVKVLSALKDFCDFYFEEEIVAYDRDASRKDFIPENKPRLIKLREALSKLPSFAAPAIESTLKAVASECSVKVGALVHPTRLACTGKPVGPSLYHLMEVLGKERVLQRLDRALAHLG
jgi:glutamyl-tRNA synthetase